MKIDNLVQQHFNKQFGNNQQMNEQSILRAMQLIF